MKVLFFKKITRAEISKVFMEKKNGKYLEFEEP